MVKVNTEGVAVGFQPVPDDNYEAKFTNYRNGKTKNNDDKIDFEFTVNEGEFQGRKLFMTQTVIPSGEKANLHFLKEVLINLGADPDDLEATIDTDEILNELRGNDVKLKVGSREFEGKTFNTVRVMDPDSWDSN